MRSLDNWMPYYDRTNNPLYGRLTFYKLHTTEKQAIYNEDGTVPLPNPISTSQYGMTDVQVFLQDADYTVKVEKWVGNGEYTLDDPNVGDWEEVRTFDNLYPAIPIEAPEGVAGIVEVSTMSKLRAVDVSGGVNYAKLLGYNYFGDMPPQYYKLVNSPSSTIQDDGGSIIRPDNSTSKVWMLIPQENIDVRVFGIFPTSTISIQSSDTSNIHNCFNYANSQGKDVYFPQYYTSTSYYWVEGGTHSIWQKMVVDKGVHIVAKPLTTSKLRIGEIQYFGDQLFISLGAYGQLSVDCDTVKTSWKCNGWAEWPGNVKTFIMDKLNSGFSISNANVKIVDTITNKNLSFTNCLIEAHEKLKDCTLYFEDCGEVSDRWLSTGNTVTLKDNLIYINNFKSANTYIEWKNMQLDPIYGDLGEQSVSGVTLLAGAVAENASFQDVTVSGDTELHNVSGRILITDGPNTSLNMIDCWITISGSASVVEAIQLRRGSIVASKQIQILTNLYLEGASVYATFYTPGVTPVYLNCAINATQRNMLDAEYTSCTISADIIMLPGPFDAGVGSGMYMNGKFFNNVLRGTSAIRLTPMSDADYSSTLVGIMGQYIGNMSDHNFIIDSAWSRVAVNRKHYQGLMYKGNYGGCPQTEKTLDYAHSSPNFQYHPLRVNDGDFKTIPDGITGTNALYFISDWRSPMSRCVTGNIYWIANLYDLEVDVSDLFSLPNFTPQMYTVKRALIQGFIRTDSNGLYNNSFDLCTPLINCQTVGNVVRLSTPQPLRFEWTGFRYNGNNDVDEQRTALWYVWNDYNGDASRWNAEICLKISTVWA